MATLSRQAGSDAKGSEATPRLSRQELIDLLNEDLRREYQAIIAYVVYSQVIKGAAYMNIAAELEKHAAEELRHALIIAKQIDYLGGEPAVDPLAVRTSDDAEEMLHFDLHNENETVRQYRQRVRQCEALGEYAMAEHIRQILVNEQEHQIDLATALGVNVPDVTIPDERTMRRHRINGTPGLSPAGRRRSRSTCFGRQRVGRKIRKSRASADDRSNPRLLPIAGAFFCAHRSVAVAASAAQLRRLEATAVKDETTLAAREPFCSTGSHGWQTASVEAFAVVGDVGVASSRSIAVFPAVSRSGPRLARILHSIGSHDGEAFC